MVEIILENTKPCLTIYKGLSLMIIMYEPMRERKNKIKLWGLWECIETHIKESFQKVPKGRKISSEALY